MTGEFPDIAEQAQQPHAAIEATEETVDDADDAEECTVEQPESEESGGETTDDELEGGDFVCPKGVSILTTCPPSDALVGATIYHRYECGWHSGVVLRLVELSMNRNLNGLYATRYDDGEFFNDLDSKNYGPTRHWVCVNKK